MSAGPAASLQQLTEGDPAWTQSPERAGRRPSSTRPETAVEWPRTPGSPGEPDVAVPPKRLVANPRRAGLTAPRRTLLVARAADRGQG
ncbi:hypothetical protein M8C17_08720 [Micromonospora sp. RHAY321]|uniref:hypothetical protein n=1 Tax=Micromonospora sp. RHAY321 TaxID=2944807 RepID=UPI00207CB090|nr:hypothetical protein [Micromonospora sp. RHAY321]MCO1595246.1 hypothetical protein [Micromonospora sp. RHAY321]